MEDQHEVYVDTSAIPNGTDTHHIAADSSGQFEDIQVQQQHLVQHATSQLDGADTLQMGTSSNMADSGTTDARIEAQHHEIPAETIPPSENMANQNTDIAQYSFSMPLVNVTDSVARIAVVVYDDPIITPVIPLEVSHFTAAPDATVNPTLEKNMDFMNNWLKQVAVNDVPFSPVISKSQKKKLNKIKANYQTRSQGPLPTPQR